MSNPFDFRNIKNSNKPPECAIHTDIDNTCDYSAKRDLFTFGENLFTIFFYFYPKFIHKQYKAILKWKNHFQTY